MPTLLNNGQQRFILNDTVRICVTFLTTFKVFTWFLIGSIEFINTFLIIHKVTVQWCSYFFVFTETHLLDYFNTHFFDSISFLVVFVSSDWWPRSCLPLRQIAQSEPRGQVAGASVAIVNKQLRAGYRLNSTIVRILSEDSHAAKSIYDIGKKYIRNRYHCICIGLS